MLTAFTELLGNFPTFFFPVKNVYFVIFTHRVQEHSLLGSGKLAYLEDAVSRSPI